MNRRLYYLRTWLLAIVTVAMFAPGCAALKATQQPGKKDLAVLTQGMPRTHVIAELGAPIWSDERNGDIVDIFAFKQGYTKGVKAGRALIHGAADVATFGLWEVVGIPAESLADGIDVRVEVHYDKQQTVRTLEVLKGDKVFEQPKLVAWWQRQREAKARGQDANPAATAEDTIAGSTAEIIDAGTNSPETVIAEDPPQPPLAPPREAFNPSASQASSYCTFTNASQQYPPH